MAFVVALALTLVVALPPAYINEAKNRHIFVGIMIPGMTVIYMWVLHKWLFAPMDQTVTTLRQSRTKPYDEGPTALTKEMRKLQAAVGILCHENEMMRQFSEGNPSVVYPHPQHQPSIEHSVTPHRGGQQGEAATTRLSQSLTPATVARDILRDPEAAAVQHQSNKTAGHGISHAVLMDVLSSSQKKEKVSIRRVGNQTVKQQNRLPQLQQPPAGDPYDDERRRPRQREDVVSPEAFSTPDDNNDGDDEEELHSFPATPQAF